MNYELLVLGILMVGPVHGYKITKIANDIAGPFCKVSHGRLYPLLNKMELDGVVRVLEQERGESERQARTYELSERGRGRFRKLMMDTTSQQCNYQSSFWLKTTHFLFLEPEDQLIVVDHYLNYCRTYLTNIGKVEKERIAMRYENPVLRTDLIENILNILKHNQQHWQLELEWVIELREKIIQTLPNKTVQEL